MRFWADSDQTVRVRWYRCQPGTPMLPYGTIFSSYNWDNPNYVQALHNYGTPLQGEALDQDRPFNSGAPPANQLVPQSVCGTAEQWAGDLLIDRDLPLTNQDCGCIPPVTGCPNCPGGSTLTHTVLAENMLNGWGPIGGLQTLTYQGGCTWTSLPRLLSFTEPAPDFTFIELLPGTTWPKAASAHWLLIVRIDGVFLFLSTTPPIAGLLWKAASWDCKSPLTLALDQGGQTFLPKDVPQFVTIDGGSMPLIGSILMDAGVDAIPPGYLQCDGSRQSQATYAQLWGRLMWTYGPDLGDGTFQLPDLRDKVLVGSGRLYGTGDLVGNDSPALVANQLPAHTHPTTVTEAVHSHTFSINQAEHDPDFVYTDNAVQAGNAPSTLVNRLTNAVKTNLTVTADANVTTGQALDVRQAGVAVRPLIYAGV